MPFTLAEVPDLSGQNFIITGASSGIGLSASRIIVSKGAHVIMACRNLNKAQPLVDDINSTPSSSGGKASVIRLDTTELDSIDQFVPSLLELGVNRLDGLLLNAGIMMVDYREIDSRSEKHPKIESQMACNVVGHFYLVHVLFDIIKASPGLRIVGVSSIAADSTPEKDSINYEVFLGKNVNKYDKVESYCNSKLADLLLVHELGRRLKNAGVDVAVVAAHPGYSRTALQERAQGLLIQMYLQFSKFFSMDSDGGALVLVMAATMPKNEMPDKPYFTPCGFKALRGAPVANGIMAKQGRDDVQALRLWETCEELCAVKTSI